MTSTDLLSNTEQRDVLVLSGTRTAIGKYGGGLKEVPPCDLAATVVREAVRRASVPPEDVGHTVFGNVIHTEPRGMYLSRVASVNGGLPVETPAFTVNRLCGSGLQAIISAAQAVMLGDADVAVAGGAESMSRGQFHHRAAAARNNGYFAGQITPIEVPGRKGTTFDTDEHIRENISEDDLARLRPAFADEGTVTAGNASGVNDAAAAVVLATSGYAEEHGLEPLGRLVAYSHAGVEPRIMGIGPVPATPKVLDRAGLKLDDIDVFEVNEAFAAQALAVSRELGLPPEQTNPNGSGVSLGHPIGATGTDPHRQGALRTAPHRWPVRPGDHVHRRRPGSRGAVRGRVSAGDVVDRVYVALRHGDRDTLTAALAPDVHVWFTAGLPAPIGGDHRGIDDCIDNGWWAIGARYAVRAEPEHHVTCEDGTLLVLGTYRGTERRTGRPIEAGFAHHWDVRDDRVVSLRQYTDSASWLGMTSGAEV